MKKYLIICIYLCFISCGKQEDAVNLSHSLSLVDSIEVDGKTLSFIWIYADAPDYNPVEATGEGITCVDDVGRYLEVLEHEIIVKRNSSLIPLAENMVNFLLYMSREDGLWYNFMFHDGTINKDHINSKAEFGFWAVRGLRGLAAGYNIFHDNEDLRQVIEKRTLCMEPHLKKILSSYPGITNMNYGKKPNWMIQGAADITNEMLLVLTKLQHTGDFDYQDEIVKFSEALIISQYKKGNSEITGMYFCWNNIWHSWGNSQAFALLEAYKITKNDACLQSVKLWADNFVPFFIEHNFPRKITVANQDFEMETYPQIAYGINSVYRGIKSLAVITKNKKYEEYAEKVFQWYFGGNIANTKMYNSGTGVCFDGINAEGINKNSGAESTIECLLSMQFREKY
ncbi:MAG: hypothetical protein ACLFQM_05565 [Fidelibacterota bacterium]